MEKLFLELGGKIHYNKEVQEILIQNKKVLGIKTKEENIKSDYVISNADFPYTMKQLIKDEKTRENIPTTKSTLWIILVLVNILLGCRRDL